MCLVYKTNLRTLKPLSKHGENFALNCSHVCENNWYAIYLYVYGIYQAETLSNTALNGVWSNKIYF